MITVDTPGEELDWMKSMPGIAFTADSITPVTLASTMSGLAPGSTVVTETIGNSIGG
ncbi:MAG: hypothetical protein RML12_00070 [Xanthomonadales bacterium]|nr:hypothetical protein [Xanthomonadales bacterium]